jgi:hypothetical protein
MKFMRYNGLNAKEIQAKFGARHCSELMNAIHPASEKNKIMQISFTYGITGRSFDVRYGDYVIQSDDGITLISDHKNFLILVKKLTDEWLNPLGYFVDMMAGDYGTLMYSHKDAHTGSKHTGIKVWLDEEMSELRCDCMCFTDGYSFIRMISGSMSYKNPHLFTQVDRMDRIRMLVDAQDAKEKLP